MIRNNRDDRLGPAVGERVQQLANELVRGTIARPRCLTLRAIVVPDGVRFVQVSEDEVIGLLAKCLQQLGANGPVRGIAMSI